MAGKPARAVLMAIAAVLIGVAPMSRAWADGIEKPMSAEEQRAAKGVIKDIQLGDGSAKLELRRGYVFLPAADVEPILRQLGVATPQAPIVGAVAAAGAKPTQKSYWISVVTLDPVGHVLENGADEIGSMAFFESVKAARPAEPSLESFAVAPAYDRAGKVLSWAEQFDAKSAPDLRHEQRWLGRAAALGVTTIGQAGRLNSIKASAAKVLSMLSFSPGQAYGDFRAGDRVSEYDLPGLITGKRRAGPLAEAADAGDAKPPSGGLTWSSFAPGGQLQWAPWLLGGMVVLGGGYLGLSALRGGGRSRDANLTPQDRDGNAV